MAFLTRLHDLVFADLAKMMGHKFHTPNLWACLFFDFLLIQLVIGPCNVLVWRGAWELYDRIFGMDGLTTGPLLFLAGFLLSIPAILFSPEVLKMGKAILESGGKVSRSPLYVLVTRVYSLISLLTMLLFWKGWFDTWFYKNGVYQGDSARGYGPEVSDHWIFSLACLVFGALLLTSIGALKTAALSPPMGLYLDTANKYCKTEMFFDDPDETKGGRHLLFRLVNTVVTLVVEVVAMITYYGAYFSIENVHYQLYGTNSASLDIAYGRPLLRDNVTDQLDRVYDPHHPCTDKQKCHLNYTLALIGLGILTAGLSYIASIFYLYLHYEAKQRSKYLNSTAMRFLYAVILIFSTIATAFHFHGDLLIMITSMITITRYWDLFTIVKVKLTSHHKETPMDGSAEDIVPEVVFFLLGFLGEACLGVGGNNHFGITKESEMEEEGMMLPFIYFTYIMRKKDNGHEEDYFVDVIYPHCW